MDDLNSKRAEHIKSAHAILDAAKADDDRDLTDEERADVEQHMADVKTVDKQIKGRQLVKSVMSLGAVDDGDDNGTDPDVKTGPAQTIGEHFAKTITPEQFALLKSVSGYTVSTPEFKAATDPQLTTGAVWSPVLTTIDQTIVHAFRPGPVVADLLGSGTVAGNAITYFLEGAVEGAFNTLVEGAAKPQLHFADPTTVTDSLKKIAAWFDMSDEMTEDLPFFVSEINNRASYLLAMFEENQLLNGPGTGSTIRGLLNRSGIQTETSAAGGAGGTDGAASLFRARTKVQTATGLTADGLIINPADYQLLRLKQDANNQYYGGGPFTGQYGVGGVLQDPPVWGLNTVVTTAVAAGTAVVGALKVAATVYRKGGVRVESTNSDAGKFTSNIITTRIEERIGLACRLPAAVVKVTFTP